jgi:hypothetical protein
MPSAETKELVPVSDERVLEIAKYWSNSRFVAGAERFLLDFAHALQREQREHGSGTKP